MVVGVAADHIGSSVVIPEDFAIARGQPQVVLASLRIHGWVERNTFGFLAQAAGGPLPNRRAISRIDIDHPVFVEHPKFAAISIRGDIASIGITRLHSEGTDTGTLRRVPKSLINTYIGHEELGRSTAAARSDQHRGIIHRHHGNAVKRRYSCGNVGDLTASSRWYERIDAQLGWRVVLIKDRQAAQSRSAESGRLDGEGIAVCDVPVHVIDGRIHNRCRVTGPIEIHLQRAVEVVQIGRAAGQHATISAGGAERAVAGVGRILAVGLLCRRCRNVIHVKLHYGRATGVLQFEACLIAAGQIAKGVTVAWPHTNRAGAVHVVINVRILKIGDAVIAVGQFLAAQRARRAGVAVDVDSRQSDRRRYGSGVLPHFANSERIVVIATDIHYAGRIEIVVRIVWRAIVILDDDVGQWLRTVIGDKVSIRHRFTKCSCGFVGGLHQRKTRSGGHIAEIKVRTLLTSGQFANGGIKRCQTIQIVCLDVVGWHSGRVDGHEVFARR